MIRSQVALIQRELWEHRAIYVTPLVIAFLVALLSLTGQVFVSSFDEAVDITILGASNFDENQRGAAISAVMTVISSLFVIAAMILSIFYTLDSLYAERKDRSILFWRSVPTTDFETVLSKLLTAILVIPLVTFAAIVVTHVIVGIFSSIWVAFSGANAWHLLWKAAPLADIWTITLVYSLALPLWLAPFFGWFLIVSAYAKRSPFLLAFLPIVVLPMLESMKGISIFRQAFFERTGDFGNTLFEGMPADGDLPEYLYHLVESGVSPLSKLALGQFLSSPSLWLGLVVCGIFTTAAIYVRRYRDDT